MFVLLWVRPGRDHLMDRPSSPPDLRHLAADHAALAVWPGDSPPRREVLLDMARGDTVTLSTLHATVHLGAHADGPCHVAADGPGHRRSPARRLPRALPGHPGQCPARNADRARRISTSRSRRSEFFCARTRYPDPNRFRTDFAALAPALVDHLHERGVRLIGIDTPSVDLFDSKDLPAHRRFLAHDMAILEGLVLVARSPGRYELIALPLRLVGFDASPVRAILRTLS